MGGSPFRIHEAEDIRVFSGCIAMGIGVKGTDNKDYDLGIEILWDEANWTICTEVWVKNEEGGSTRLCELPERFAIELSDCLNQTQDAIEDLFGLQTFVPGNLCR